MEKSVEEQLKIVRQEQKQADKRNDILWKRQCKRESLKLASTLVSIDEFGNPKPLMVDDLIENANKIYEELIK